MKKHILWLTADYFIDVDFFLVPYMKEHYPQYDIEWVALSGAGSNIQIDNSLPCRIVKFAHRSRSPKLMGEYKQLFASLGRKQYDLIYSDVVGFPYHYHMLYRFAGNTPIVHAAHNVIPYPAWQWWLKLYVKYIFATNSHFQLFSQFTAQYFAQRYPGKSFFYCPMTLKGYGAMTTNRYKIDPAKLNLLFFGNVMANKRLDLLIDAVKMLPADVKQRVHLTIAGRCANPRPYIEQIAGDPAIETHFERIDDCAVAELFVKHDFLVLPYQDVAQSGPHMIAYYYGVPVIASDIEGFRERVIDGQNGLLYENRSAAALSEKIAQAARMTPQEMEAMRNSLNEFAQENYSLRCVSRKYVEYFEKITQ